MQIPSKLIFCTTLGFNALIQANATGMAVTLNNLYLANTSTESIVVTLNNLNQTPKVSLSPKSVCKLPQAVFFTPNLIKNDNNFYILFTINNDYDAIVMNPDSISLASNSDWSNAYTEDSSKFYLEAICNKKPLKTKIIVTTTLNPKDNPPTIAPKICSNNYKFVYSYGKPGKQVSAKALNSAKNCL